MKIRTTIIPDAGLRTKLLLLFLFLAAFGLRIVLAVHIQGHPFDLRLFRSWATAAANNLSRFYSGGNSSDYPPLYIYVLYGIGKIGGLSGMSPYMMLLLKLPSILADLLTAFLLYKLAGKYLSPKLIFWIPVFYLFNPAVFVNSAIWGQADSFFTLLVVSAILLLSEHKIILAAVFFAAAVLMKPQGLIFVPVLFFELVRQKKMLLWFKALLAGVVTAAAIILPFSPNMNPLWIIKLYTGTLAEYPYASVNAFNLFHLLGANYTRDSSTLLFFSYHTWGMVFIFLITCLAWYLYIRKNSSLMAPPAALLLISGVFIFSGRMHERYLFPAVALALLAFIYCRDKRMLQVFAGFSLTSFVNTYLVLLETSRKINPAISVVIPQVMAILNLVIFACLVRIMFGPVKSFQNVHV